MVNKQGQTRLAHYTTFKSIKERVTLEGALVRKWLSRTNKQCSFLEHRQYKIIYRRYASLYFILGLDLEDDCNELSLLELIHNIVETLDKYFENVCELDIMFNIEKARFIVDEFLMHGCLVDANRTNILSPITLIDKQK